MGKMLIVYYSWSNGNTKRIAELLQRETGADLVRIETVHPYEGSYQDVVDQGKWEADSGFQPEIKPLPYAAADYDVIAVGTPTWWYTMAPAVLTYLNQQDWNGKTVVPFLTNAGWPGHVIRDMKKACKGAQCACEMQVKFDADGGDRMETSEGELQQWIQRVRELCQ